MAASPVPHYTPEEYLRLDRYSNTRHEYLDGLVYAMAGGSLPHIEICGNLIERLRPLLREKGCSAGANDLRVQLSSTGPYYYPDIVVWCGEPQMLDMRSDTLTNPILLMEILSTSTEGYDRGVKRDAYLKLPTLREYVLVSQDKALIQSYVRQIDGQWICRELHGIHSQYVSAAVDVTIPMADIYAGVDLSSPPA